MRSRSGRPSFCAVLFALVGLLSGCGRRSPQLERIGGGDQGSATGGSSQALPDSAFRVRWSHSQLPATLPSSSITSIEITITNEGDTRWPNPETADPSRVGAYAVRLSHRWYRAGDVPDLAGYETRVDLPSPLAPGDSVTLSVPLTVPHVPGEYRLQFDLVQELFAWFESKGASTLVLPVTVQ